MNKQYVPAVRELDRAIALNAGQTSKAIQYFNVAGSSNSAEGAQARAQLATLTLPSQPGKYLQVQYGLDRHGYLTLAVINRAPVTAGNITIQAEYILPNGEKSRSNYQIRRIDPGKTEMVQTRIGRFNAPDELRGRVRAQVVSASAAR